MPKYYRAGVDPKTGRSVFIDTSRKNTTGLASTIQQAFRSSSFTGAGIDSSKIEVIQQVEVSAKNPTDSDKTMTNIREIRVSTSFQFGRDIPLPQRLAAYNEYIAILNAERDILLSCVEGMINDAIVTPDK